MKKKNQSKNHIKRFGSNFRYKLPTWEGWNTEDSYSEEIPRVLFSQLFHCPEKHTSVCMEHLCPSTEEQPEQVYISFFFVYQLTFYNLSCVTRRVCTNYFLHNSSILHSMDHKLFHFLSSERLLVKKQCPPLPATKWRPCRQD